MCDNCRCKSNQIEIDNSSLDMLRSQPKIEIIEVETDYGTQLKFAVPESGMNEPSVGVVEDLRDEVLGMIDYKLSLHIRHGFTVEQLCESIKSDIKNIFEKYRK